MARPGTRFFIGPLTPAQQRRRQRSRERYRELAEICDARYISMCEAFRVMRRNRVMRPLLDARYVWNG